MCYKPQILLNYTSSGIKHKLTLVGMGSEVCEPFLTLISGSKYIIILLEEGKAILLSAFGGIRTLLYMGSTTFYFSFVCSNFYYFYQ